jgi:hypothetical protein
VNPLTKTAVKIAVKNGVALKILIFSQPGKDRWQGFITKKAHEKNLRK